METRTRVVLGVRAVMLFIQSDDWRKHVLMTRSLSFPKRDSAGCDIIVSPNCAMPAQKNRGDVNGAKTLKHDIGTSSPAAHHATARESHRSTHFNHYAVAIGSDVTVVGCRMAATPVVDGRQRSLMQKKESTLECSVRDRCNSTHTNKVEQWTHPVGTLALHVQ